MERHAFAMAFQDDPKLATGAGAAYAAGILMQFALNLLDCGGIAELIVLGATTIVISALSAAPQATDEGSSHTVNPFIEPSHALAKQACWSIALVMILQRPRHHRRADLATPLFGSERSRRRHRL